MKFGTCYETAFRALFDGQHDEWTLVHGRPTLTVEPFIEYGHAWLEDPDGVSVYDSETKSYWPVDVYYKYGKIDPRKSNRYTKQQAVKWALKVKHYGPWEGPEAVGVWSKKAERAANKGRAVKRNPYERKIVRTTQAMYERLLNEFGVSDAMGVRGFILDDGQCLNLGQYDDHRIINCVYADSDAAEARFGSRYGAFANLCRKFNMIRWIPESKMVEIFVPTTRDQDRTIMDLADAGYLKEAEVHKPRGGTVMLEAEDGETLVRGINAILG